MPPLVKLIRPGVVPYDAAHRWQIAAADALRAGEDGEYLALLEHPPVYTMGRRGGRRSLLVSDAELQARGAPVVDSDRGGDITFHGPGQLIAYPILDLRARALGAVDYMRCLEAAIIDTLAAFAVRAERVPGRPGVWVGDEKIAAVGVRVRRGVSRHGVALNVVTDLAWFDAIVPCGISGAGVTSLDRLGAAPPASAVATALAQHLAAQLGLDLRAEPTPRGLRPLAMPAPPTREAAALAR